MFSVCVCVCVCVYVCMYVCVHVDFLFFLPKMVNKVEYIKCVM